MELEAAGTSRDGDVANIDPVAVEHALEIEDGCAVHIPVEFRFEASVYVLRGKRWRDLLGSLPADDAGFLRAVDSRYFGALSYDSIERLRSLAGTGFPMPEEWLAARRTADADLVRSANAGNIKAKMFLLDRISGGVAARSGSGVRERSDIDREMFRQSAEAKALAEDLLRNHRSPFAAYLAGRMLSAAMPGTPPEPIAASFLLAAEMGDSRADGLRIEFEKSHPGMNQEAVSASYLAMRSRVDGR